MSTSSNYFPQTQNKCEDGMGEAGKRTEMVEDRSCEKSVSDRVACGKVCVVCVCKSVVCCCVLLCDVV